MARLSDPSVAWATLAQRSFAPGACCCSPIIAPATSAASLGPTTRLPSGPVIRVALPYGCVLAGPRDLPPFTAVPFHHATFSDPGEPDGCICPVLPRRLQPSPGLNRLGAPSPTVRSGVLSRGPGGFTFRGSIGQPDGLLASWADRPGTFPAAETFTPEFAPNESPPSGVGHNYSADWTIAPAGLSPAGTAAYWAALNPE